MAYDNAEVAGDRATPRFSVEYRAQGRLVAVDAVNDARAHMMSRRRIAEECPLERVAGAGAALVTKAARRQAAGLPTRVFSDGPL